MIIRAEHSERQRELTPEALRRELTPEALRLRRVNKVFGMQSERSAASDNANRHRQLAGGVKINTEINFQKSSTAKWLF